MPLLGFVSWDQFWAGFDHTYEQYQGINPAHLVLMMLPFWVTLLSTWFLAIKPLMRVREEREKRTVGARNEAAEFEAKFNERFKAYEERLASTRQQAHEARGKGRRDAEAEAERTLGAAREQAAKTLEDVREAIESERTRVRGELRRQAESIAHELAEKALGREIGDNANETKRGSSRSGVRS